MVCKRSGRMPCHDAISLSLLPKVSLKHLIGFSEQFERLRTEEPRLFGTLVQLSQVSADAFSAVLNGSPNMTLFERKSHGSLLFQNRRECSLRPSQPVTPRMPLCHRWRHNRPGRGDVPKEVALEGGNSSALPAKKSSAEGSRPRGMSSRCPH
jgi:hypothetical protein